jgi:hypothetical protein
LGVAREVGLSLHGIFSVRHALTSLNTESICATRTCY